LAQGTSCADIFTRTSRIICLLWLLVIPTGECTFCVKTRAGPSSVPLDNCIAHLHKHYINHNQTLFALTFRSLSETFVRRSCSVLLPVLATVVMRRRKKSVVRVTQCIAGLVPVHRTPSLLSGVHCFLNPSGTSIRLLIQNCRFSPVDCMAVMYDLHDQSKLIYSVLTNWIDVDISSASIQLVR